MLAQLEKKDWIALIKEVINHWHEADRLNQHKLADLRMVERNIQTRGWHADPNRRAKALRLVIRSAIDNLGVEGEEPPREDNIDDPRWMDRRWRLYSLLVLSLNYVQREVSDRIGVALAGQFYRDQARALEALAELLRNQEGNPVADGSTAGLSYPSGAMRLDDPFYIERDVDLLLAEALKRPGETVTIRGPRQVGKTSLLSRGIYQARRQFDARVVYFDLQEVGGQTVSSLDIFLRNLAMVTFDELDLDLGIIDKAWDSPLPPKSKLTKLFDKHVLRSIEQPVLLSMDEIDQLQLTDFGTEFFALVRSWHNRRATQSAWQNLSIIMAISTEPYLLIDDANQSPFNVGQILRLKDFSPAQVADLNKRYGSPIGEEELERMYDLLGGHPYLIRVALYTMVKGNRTWSELEQMATTDDGPFHQHLQHLYRFFMRDEKLKTTYLEIVRNKVPADDQAAFRLMKAGLAHTNAAGDYECRCRLYRSYFAGRF